MKNDFSRKGELLVMRGSDPIARVPIAGTFATRLRGLMGKKSLDESEGLFLADCARVHTCFMRFPIDVLYLDSDLRGIEVETIPPWRFGKKVKEARHTLEMPAGLLVHLEPSSIKLARD